MPRITVPYLDRTLEAELTNACHVETLDVAEAPAVEDVGAAFASGCAAPIGMSGSALDAFRAGETVCIVISDQFRHTAMEQVLPHLVDALNARGIRDEDISFLVGTGTHRSPTVDEQRQLLGSGLYNRFSTSVFNHDAHGSKRLVQIGQTTRGTPAVINRLAVEADRLIVTGAVVLHYFGGFGGGRKGIFPGIAGVEFIAANHSKNLHATRPELDPAVRIGAMEGNPVAEDMLEAARLVKTDLLINTVLTQSGAIAGLFIGGLEAAHEEACKLARNLYSVPISAPADIVIAASHATRNFVQTHKALYNAYQAVHPEGRIVLCAPCPEGLGGRQFSQWLELGEREAIIAALRQQAEINGQTALSTLEKTSITALITEMDDASARRLGARKMDALQDAIDAALRYIDKPQPTVYVMPHAAVTVPFQQK